MRTKITAPINGPKPETDARINWFKVKNEAGSPVAEILIYDQIGRDYYDESGVGATQFNDSLKAIPDGKPILVRINSPGGNVWDALAIYNMLDAMRERVTCRCDGIAASSASLIFLAGGKRIIPTSAMLMMHNPTDMCFGDADEMRARAEKLDAHKAVIASIYVANSNMSQADVMAKMDAETWMSGQQCRDCKMATEVTEEAPVQNNFDMTRFRHAPGASVKNPKQNAPQNVAQKSNIMNRDEMIALLRERGIAVANDATDDWLKAEVRKLIAPTAAATPPANAGAQPPATQAATAPANGAPAAPAQTQTVTAPTLEARLARMEQVAADERRGRITTVVNGLVENMQLTAEEAPKAIVRAIADETYLDELRARPALIPGAEPVNSGLVVVGDDARNSMAAIQKHILTGPKCAAMDAQGHAKRGAAMGAIWRRERERILPVLNAATNTVDSALKRVAILNETVRAFATRIIALRVFATSFGNVPLQGTDEVVVGYYALQTAASSDFNTTTGYAFDQATGTSMKKITVNKRKYQPIDYSSQEFRRQPYFNAVELGAINAEKLGVDICRDVLSVITAANYGAAVKTAAAAAMNSDDVVDIAGACNDASWPEAGRGLIVDTSIDTALKKDTAYKLALNIGGTEVIRDGKLPKISGFNYGWMPSFPDNGEKLIGAAVFQSGILAAFAPVDPAPGVRQQLIAYEVASDEASGVSMNYKHWGDAKLDRDFEVIESAYGYQAGEAAAIKRICKP